VSKQTKQTKTNNKAEAEAKDKDKAEEFFDSLIETAAEAATRSSKRETLQAWKEQAVKFGLSGLDRSVNEASDTAETKYELLLRVGEFQVCKIRFDKAKRRLHKPQLTKPQKALFTKLGLAKADTKHFGLEQLPIAAAATAAANGLKARAKQLLKAAGVKRPQE